MKLLECSEQSIQLRGYSRTSSFQIKSAHSLLYVTFKIESHPRGEFIVIPDEGLIAPNEYKEFKIYLSKGSLHKEELPNSYIQIIGGLGYRYNESIVRQERLGNWEDVQLQHSTIIVPVMVSSEYSQLRSEFRAGSIYSRVSKGSAPFGSFNGSGLPHSQQPAQLSREDSFKSSISMHSEHLIEEDELLSPKQINSKQQIPFPQRPAKVMTSGGMPSGNQLSKTSFPYQPVIRPSESPQHSSRPYQISSYESQQLGRQQPISTRYQPIVQHRSASSGARNTPLRAIDMIENVMGLAVKQSRQIQQARDLQRRRTELATQLETQTKLQTYKDQSTEFLIMVFFVGLFISFGSQLRHLLS